MNLSTQPSRHQETSIRWPRGILYGMLLLAVLVSLPLGMVIAAMGAWFAIRGGSLIYLPVGLVILLAGLAILRSHSIADFLLLALLGFAMIAWSISGIDARSWMLSSVVELSGRIDLLLGLLVTMVLAFFVVHWHRIFAGPAGRLRLVWVGIPLLLLTAGSASVGSFVLASVR